MRGRIAEAERARLEAVDRVRAEGIEEVARVRAGLAKMREELEGERVANRYLEDELAKRGKQQGLADLEIKQLKS